MALSREAEEDKRKKFKDRHSVPLYKYSNHFRHTAAYLAAPFIAYPL